MAKRGRPRVNTDPCAAPGCERMARALGFCQKHWWQLRHRGRLLETHKHGQVSDPTVMLEENRVKLTEALEAYLAASSVASLVRWSRIIKERRWLLADSEQLMEEWRNHEGEMRMRLSGGTDRVCGEHVGEPQKDAEYGGRAS